MTRPPEPTLDVQWQRHLPAGLGKEDTVEAVRERVRCITQLAHEVEQALFLHEEILDDHDLVVTISKLPIPKPPEVP